MEEEEEDDDDGDSRNVHSDDHSEGNGVAVNMDCVEWSGGGFTFDIVTSK